MTPDLLADEIAKLAVELKGVPFSLLYDGGCLSTLAEAAILRWVERVPLDTAEEGETGPPKKKAKTKSAKKLKQLSRSPLPSSTVPAPETWTLRQAVVACKYLAAAVSGHELRGFLYDALHRLGLSFRDSVATCRDNAPTNCKCQRLLLGFFEINTDVPCFCHLLNNTLKKMHLPVLEEYLALFTTATCNSDRAVLHFRDHLSETPMRSTIRWMSSLLQACQHFRLLPKLPTFYQALERDGISEKTMDKIMLFLRNEEHVQALAVEMAIVMDVTAVVFPILTFLEGDGFLSPFVTARLNLVTSLWTSVEGGAHVNLTEAAKRLAEIEAGAADGANFVAAQERLVAYGRACVVPAAVYWRQHLAEPTIHHAVSVFACCRLWDPVYMGELFRLLPNNVGGAVRELLRALPCVYPEELEALIAELPVYHQEIIDAVDGLQRDSDTLLELWSQLRYRGLPNWAEVACRVVCIQPSEASVERLYAMGDGMITRLQDGQLEDAVSVPCVVL
jgi:hypothetical protein